MDIKMEEMERKELFKTIKDNIDNMLSQISDATVIAGRKAEDVKLMAVTKTKPLIYAEAAYSAGLRLFGENRVQEMEEKFTDFHKDAEIHLIGHLQRNKIKKTVPVASSIDSIDKYETAAELATYCNTIGHKADILIEFNTSGEDSKSGFLTEKELLETVDRIQALGILKIKGLMTIAPFTDDKKMIRNSFIKLRTLFEKVEKANPNLLMDTLSMGMSSDFKIAIEEGSTIIRIGTALFGTRNYVQA